VWARVPVPALGEGRLEHGTEIMQIPSRKPGQVSVKQKRHGEHDSVTVTIAEGFRSASYELSIFIKSDVRHS
jgi:hypothetical protein